MPVTYCPKCCFRADKLVAVVNHIAQRHSFDSKFHVVCGISGCQKNYTNFQAYRRHLYRCHVDTLRETGSRIENHAASADNTYVDFTDSSDTTPSDFSTEPPFDSEDQPVSFETFISETRKSFCKFYFKTSEKYKMPHSVASAVFSDCQSMLQNVVQTFAMQVLQALSGADISEDVKILLSCSFLPGIFSGLETHYQRVQFAKSVFPHVAPQELKFPDEKASFQYIPIGPLLKCLCEVPQYAAGMFEKGDQEESKQESEFVMKSFMDGALYKRCFADFMPEQDQYTLLLLMYTDELEIVNPLGAARGKYKIVCVYFSLLNLHRKYRSQLQSIHLLLLARYVHVQKFGMDEFLKPLIEDLNQIQKHGIPVMIGNTLRMVKAAIYCFCGDNLSLNRLGGFSCCFSGGRFCRFCLASSQNLSVLTTEQSCVVRNMNAHRRHLSGILVNGIVSKRLYGVTGPSPLLKLHQFDVTLQLPPDIMHDILEGSFEQVLKQVLTALISQGMLKFDDLDKISTFPYGFQDKKNKPEPVPKSFINGHTSLKGTASQKWCLLRLLPLIFGDSLPPKNQDWEVFLLYREICNLCFAPEITEDLVAYLQIKIQDLLCLFVARYPDIPLKPKLHFLVHYPRFIMELGPLSQFWSMRFEPKHQTFKSLAAKTKNFRNICRTLASRHQLLQCYELESFSFDEEVSTSAATPVKEEDVHQCAR
ncbi:uncharacterized protein LOC135393295 [Ornithodoros turicata]|uniref:uncharacterized protein LOC135393295 n=1 Tax=Ornithodoros turicata TaxID=34597 RepID=UPI00313966C5